MQRNNRKIIVRLEREGWIFVKAEGSHHKFRNPETKKIIVVPHPRKDLPKGTARNIAKHAGWL
jgi:predicted RNA binding protein YcfA (HicA-like mRNA interferase family)